MDREAVLFAILDSIIQISDRAEAAGGATSISGVATLHTMQKSIQSNKPRILQLLREKEPNK